MEPPRPTFCHHFPDQSSPMFFICPPKAAALSLACPALLPTLGGAFLNSKGCSGLVTYMVSYFPFQKRESKSSSCPILVEKWACRLFCGTLISTSIFLIQFSNQGLRGGSGNGEVKAQKRSQSSDRHVKTHTQHTHNNVCRTLICK